MGYFGGLKEKYSIVHLLWLRWKNCRELMRGSICAELQNSEIHKGNEYVAVPSYEWTVELSEFQNLTLCLSTIHHVLWRVKDFDETHRQLVNNNTVSVKRNIFRFRREHNNR